LPAAHLLDLHYLPLTAASLSLFVDPVLGHYEQFDVQYKRLLPLKRIYIPELCEDVEWRRVKGKIACT
jgi:hypothetical protein